MSPPLPPSRDELLFALSQIVLRRDYRPPSYKHPKLLDLLSLLLTQSSDDVTAVMLRVLPKGQLQLNFSKNRPCTQRKKDYIAHLMAIVSAPKSNIDKKHLDILEAVIVKCKKKMKSRLNKLCSRLKNLKDWDFVIHHNVAAEMVDVASGIREQVGSKVFLPEELLGSFLQGWFRYLLDGSLPEWPKGVYQTLLIAYYVGNARGIEGVLDGNLLGRMRKLGDYFAAALALVKAAAELTEAQLNELKIIEVVPTVPCTLEFSKDPLHIVNSWAQHKGYDPVTFDELCTAYPSMSTLPAPPGTQAVTASVHCECTLLLDTIASHPTPTPMVLEIGMSKPSCWMCWELVKLVREQHHHFTVHVSSCHGKYVAGWSLPGEAPEKLVKAVDKRVWDEMDEVVQRAAAKRKSDSILRGAGSEDGGGDRALVPERNARNVEYDGGYRV